MQTTSRSRNLFAAVSLAVLAVGVVAATTWTPSRQAPVATAVSQVATQVSMIGMPTGELQDGVPVYRLPPVAVVVSRSVELAKIAREERLALK